MDVISGRVITIEVEVLEETVVLEVGMEAVGEALVVAARRGDGK